MKTYKLGFTNICGISPKFVMGLTSLVIILTIIVMVLTKEFASEIYKSGFTNIYGISPKFIMRLTSLVIILIKVFTNKNMQVRIIVFVKIIKNLIKLLSFPLCFLSKATNTRKFISLRKSS